MPAPRKLTVDTIVTTAFDLLQLDGLDAVTQRAIAQKLEVEAASLYRHVPSKERILALVTLTLFKQQIDQVGLPPTWKDWLTNFGKTLWQTQREIPDCARLVITTRFNVQDYAAMSQWASAPLRTYGISRAAALEMQISLQAIVLGLAGIAYGPNSTLIRKIIPVDQLLDEAIEALISGWENRLFLSAGRDWDTTASSSNAADDVQPRQHQSAPIAL